MEFNSQLIWSTLPLLLKGLKITVELVALSCVIGLVIAVPLALARVSKNKWLKSPAYTYIFFFRGTPLFVQLFLIYYGSGQFQERLEAVGLWTYFREPFFCAAVAFSLNTAAYVGELLRGAIQAVPVGEIEACLSLGFSRPLYLRRIVLPRAFAMILPAYCNEVILLIKASSLASTVTLMDIMGVARSVAAEHFAPIEVFCAAGILYVALTFIVTIAFSRIARHTTVVA